MQIAVLLSGRLRLDGYGLGRPDNGDGTFPLSLGEGSAVCDAIRTMGLPTNKVSLVMVNGHKCGVGCSLKANDRVILIPSDVAALWEALGRMNMGAESVCDFGTSGPQSSQNPEGENDESTSGCSRLD